MLVNADASRKRGGCSADDQREHGRSVLQPQHTAPSATPRMKTWAFPSCLQKGIGSNAYTRGCCAVSSHREGMLVRDTPRTQLCLLGGLRGDGWWQSVLSSPGSKLAALCWPRLFSKVSLLFPKFLLPHPSPSVCWKLPSIAKPQKCSFFLKTPVTLFSRHLGTNKFLIHFPRVGAPLSFAKLAQGVSVSPPRPAPRAPFSPPLGRDSAPSEAVQPRATPA